MNELHRYSYEEYASNPALIIKVLRDTSKELNAKISITLDLRFVFVHRDGWKQESAWAYEERINLLRSAWNYFPSEIFINTARSLLLPLRDEQLDLFKFENPANIRNEKGGLVENIKFNVYYLEPEQNRVLRALNKIDWKNILHNEWMFSEKMDK